MAPSNELSFPMSNMAAQRPSESAVRLHLQPAQRQEEAALPALSTLLRPELVGIVIHYLGADLPVLAQLQRLDPVPVINQACDRVAALWQQALPVIQNRENLDIVAARPYQLSPMVIHNPLAIAALSDADRNWKNTLLVRQKHFENNPAQPHVLQPAMAAVAELVALGAPGTTDEQQALLQLCATQLALLQSGGEPTASEAAVKDACRLANEPVKLPRPHASHQEASPEAIAFFSSLRVALLRTVVKNFETHH